MPKPCASKPNGRAIVPFTHTGRRLRLILALASVWLAWAGGAHAAAGSLRFDDVFATKGEPARLHYVVAFRSGGATHRMELWRDGDRRVRRDTDRALTTFAVHRPGEAGYQLAILDRQKHVRTDIARTNLYRIGQFADWFDLGHGLRHPKGTYRLSRREPPSGLTPIRPCTWYDLAEGARTTAICWDAAYHVPLLIAGGDGQPLWKMIAVDTRPIPASRFTIDDRNYVHENADRDIERD